MHHNLLVNKTRKWVLFFFLQTREKNQLINPSIDQITETGLESNLVRDKFWEWKSLGMILRVLWPEQKNHWFEPLLDFFFFFEFNKRLETSSSWLWGFSPMDPWLYSERSLLISDSAQVSPFLARPPDPVTSDSQPMPASGKLCPSLGLCFIPQLLGYGSMVCWSLEFDFPVSTTTAVGQPYLQAATQYPRPHRWPRLSHSPHRRNYQDMKTTRAGTLPILFTTKNP